MNTTKPECTQLQYNTTSCLYRLLSVIDTLICCFIIFPLCVFHWRGCWDLLDVYIYPLDEVRSSWVTLFLGSLLTVSAYVIQPFLTDKLKTCCSSKVTYTIVTRFYLYMFGWAALCYWRGVWNLQDHYFGVGFWSSVIWLVGCEGGLLIFRSSRTLVGVPFSISLDTQMDLMDPDIMHLPCTDQNLKEEFPGWAKYISAVGFSQFLLMTMNISVWRCIWNILDDCLLPHHPFLSDTYSLVFGYAITFLIFLCQVPTSVISELLGSKSATLKLIFEDVVFFIATWAVLLIWRGAWDLMEKYFLPDKLVGGWVSHWIGTVGLIALQGFRNVGANGLDLDGGYHAGTGIYPTHYLREFFKDKFQDEATLETQVPLLDSAGPNQELDAKEIKEEEESIDESYSSLQHSTSAENIKTDYDLLSDKTDIPADHSSFIEETINNVHNTYV